MSNSINILVTGGAGYIGSHIVEQLLKFKNKVFILDNLSTGYTALLCKKAQFIKADIKNLKKVKSIIKINNIDTIFHLAACLNIKEAETNKKKYYLNNIKGTLNLVNACKNSNVKNIIFSSSCSVYGKVKKPVSEKKRLNPKGYYAYTKASSEKIIKKYANKFGYKYAILRYFNVVGASQSKKIGEIQGSHDHLFKNIAIQSQIKKPQISIYGANYQTKDGTCVRDYMHVSDLADIHLKTLRYMLVKSRSIILNCGYGKGYSVLEIIEAFKKIKKNVHVKIKDKRKGDVAEVFANINKLTRVLKWIPKHNSVIKLLNSSIDWEKRLKKIDIHD